jgi:acyl carrier protein
MDADSGSGMTSVTEQEALVWVARLFDEAPEKIEPATKRGDTAAWDSLGVLTLLASLDSDFGIVLSDEEIHQMDEVRDILEILRRNGKLQ